MGVSVYPIPASGGGSLKSYVVTLTSGSSWTVPTGVTNINATLQGGGGGGPTTSAGTQFQPAGNGRPGQMITTNFNTTPGASISYSIGAGGSQGNNATPTPVLPGPGGTTTMTGATSAVGGVGAKDPGTTTGVTGTSQAGWDNGGGGTAGTGGGSLTTYSSGAGGAGRIIIEYWV
jgi:hypothetical protein